MKLFALPSWLLNGSILFGLFACSPVAAEIVPDTTLPNNSTVTLIDTIREINGGTLRGDNLFHSFQEFSFSEGTAFFNNNDLVRNIITRVTGGSPSNIDGVIQANGTANLFFINPGGIIFGQNASLQIGGSFIASTANSIRFADSFEFSATAPTTSPLLTVSVPIGLQFGQNPEAIRNESTSNLVFDDFGTLIAGGLQVPFGKTLALVGGDVTFAGGIAIAEGGRIELGSVAGSNFVNLIPTESGWMLEYNGVQNFQDINFSQFATASTTGSVGGSIQIQGKNITLTDAAFVVSSTLGAGTGGNVVANATESIKLDLGAGIATFALGEGRAGDVVVKASNSVVIAGTSEDGIFPTGFASQVFEEATGSGGNVIVETGRLLIRDGATVDASTFGEGQAGNVTIKALDAVELSGTTADGAFPSGIFAQVGDRAIENAGDAGTLTIETRNLTILGGSQISASARKGGNGGDLTINASDSIFISGTSSIADLVSGSSGLFVTAERGGTAGNAGTLNLSTGVLTVENGGRISANNFGTGGAGSLNLNVRELVIRNGGFISANSFDGAVGGDLNVNATESIQISGMGNIGENEVRSSLLTQAQSFTQPDARGNAGDLNITTGSLIIQNGAEVSVSNLLQQGDAGNLTVQAQSINLDNGGRIIGTTQSGTGGNLSLSANDLLLLRRRSEISTSAGSNSNPGDGGNITINVPNGFVIAVPDENSDITANAFEGQGGRISIDATDVFGFAVRTREDLARELGTDDPSELDPDRLPTSDITAFSQTDPALEGEVIIDTSDTDPNRGLVELPTGLADVSELVASTCEEFGPSVGSEFVVTGRGGLPPSPDEPLTSDVVWSDTRIPKITSQQVQPLAKKPSSDNRLAAVVPATGWVFNNKGEVTLISHAHNSTSLRSTPASCAR